MKKNFSVNIQGRLFHIDEDAYELLEDYFAELEKTFEEEPNCREIINDFQIRISEALWHIVRHQEQALVNIHHVQKVLAGLGYFSANQDETGEADKKTHFPKRLFRNPENRIFGGVCGGIASYMNIDPLMVRILFAVFGLFLVGIVTYFILWIVIPLATSPIDRLNMKGEPISIGRVKEMIRKEFQHCEKSFLKMRKKQSGHHVLWEIEHQLKDFFRVSVLFRSVTGGLLIAFSLLVVTGICIFLLVTIKLELLPGIQLSDFGQLGKVFFDSVMHGVLLKWSLFLILIVPFGSMLFFGISLLSGVQFRTGVIRWISQYTATISLLIVIFSAALLYVQFLFLDKSETVYVVEPNYHREIILDITDTDEAFSSDTISASSWFFAHRNDSLFIAGKPEFQFLPSLSDSLLVVVQKRAYGRNASRAAENNSNIFFMPFLSRDTLFFPKRWSSYNALWRGQNVRILLYFPVGKEILFSDTFIRWYMPIFASRNEEMTFKMTDSGLKKK